MGSPFTSALLEAAAEDVRCDGPAARLLEPWAGSGLKAQFEAATPLRLAAAFHHLALTGGDAALSEAYRALDPERAWIAARIAAAREPARLAAFMTHEPQTNEVRRSIVLLGGFLQVARETALPLRCFELGASAGLNLSWDSYRYELDGAAWGDPEAPVRMDTDWSGPLPALDARVDVVERAGCDRRPTDLADAGERLRLLAYYWPDQTERLARIQAAIAHALATGVHVEKADAVEWTRRRIAPRAGTATVVYHSSFWGYLPAGKQAELRGAIEALGARATAEAPFAWLSMEPPPDRLSEDELSLTLWPGGETRRLAETQPHGAWVKWRSSRAAPI